MSDASKLRDTIDSRIDKYIYSYADAYFNDIDSRTLHDDLYKKLVLDLKDIIEEECNRVGLK
nr:MAG TPA: hypothetical protein [Caudoviricetes sp.]